MSKYAKPSTLSLPSPDQKISARWLLTQIRGRMTGHPSSFRQGEDSALSKLGASVIRKAHNLAQKELQAERRRRRC